MELNKLETVESHGTGAECNILSPVDGMPTDVYIKIAGADSRVWRAAKKKQTQAIISARADSKMDSLDYENMDASALAEATISWRGITKDGKEYEFNKGNAKKLYSESPSVANQLIEFLSNRANFTKG
tara:strand:+ start:3329 stop:3712 length:384 start_codon:yes stop_codon:yes gene_type:complete